MDGFLQFHRSNYYDIPSRLDSTINPDITQHTLQPLSNTTYLTIIPEPTVVRPQDQYVMSHITIDNTN